MIDRQDTQGAEGDLWTRLSAALPATAISWRQDGRPISRDGKFFARFVSYVEANTVRERLDDVVPGEWNLALELLPALPGAQEGEDPTPCAFKARLQILGVVREDVGTGKDYKQAATDAFKRVAVRFGIAHELYAMEQNWVAMDGDGKFAKPLEEPAVAYERRWGQRVGAAAASPAAAPSPSPQGAAGDPVVKPIQRAAPAADVPPCPKCGGREMWSNVKENDERAARGEKLRPDYKCKSRSCDGVVWRPKSDGAKGGGKQAVAMTGPGADDIPF